MCRKDQWVDKPTYPDAPHYCWDCWQVLKSSAEQYGQHFEDIDYDAFHRTDKNT